MAQKEERDWSKEVSKQIGVYKTDKGLLELWDSLKPASPLFPAHIHATGEKAEEGERSLIRLNMLDYSSGTGDHTVSVYANINPEEARYIYSALFGHLLDFEYAQDKIFGPPDQNGLSMVTKLSIKRYDTDNQGKKRSYPWFIEIQNGRGRAVKNSNGGRYCGKGSYLCSATVRLFISDKDLFQLFGKANSYINVFEQEYAFRQNRMGNFGRLYVLLQKEIQAVAQLLSYEEERVGNLKKAG